ncbi:Alpha/Beta hydrolase protein [Stachybotrys elegans]|uniref:Alpha/Beta hydrolase protein n=1 Tax=Stachybotrys elegans TaxID=80388 RepID=A0A8K0SMP1_9HYPO|nr:Alpha/Beta hydrolase protein [Stachybotrys elegans]
MALDATHAIIHNEGCDLHYCYKGTGPLLLFVPGGNGHGRQFYQLMDRFADRYTCATFDRRQMTASQVAVNKILNPYQQARDIVAIIKALGFAKATIFGSSLGGLLTFVVAAEYPEIVEHMISHEGASFPLLPDYPQVFEWTLSLIDMCNEKGWEAAHAEFRKMFKGYEPAKDGGVPRMKPEADNTINFWKNELLVATTFRPDLDRVKKNGVSVGLMRGVLSEDATYARCTYEQEKILECERWDVPGHHTAFETQCDVFLPHMERMLDVLKKKASQA